MIDQHTTFSTVEELNKLFKLADYPQYERTITEVVKGWTDRKIGIEMYNDLKKKEPWTLNTEIDDKVIPLLTTRFWKVQEQVRIMIEETVARFCYLELEQEPFDEMLRITIDRYSQKTELAMYNKIIKLIHPITLDFPREETLESENGVIFSKSDPIPLSDLRFLYPGDSIELEDYIDEPWYENVYGWENGHEIAREIGYDILTEHIPEEYYQLREVYENTPSREVRDLLFNNGRTITWEL